MNLRPGRRVLAALAAAVLVAAASTAALVVASRPSPVSARNLTRRSAPSAGPSAW
jgi:type IV pilus biogenesis protein CpaD/CtpE